jgi:hypothetical protein
MMPRSEVVGPDDAMRRIRALDIGGAAILLSPRG